MKLKDAKVSILFFLISRPPPPSSIHCARITRPHFLRTSRDQLVRVMNEVVVRKLAKFSDFHSDLKRCMSC